MMPKKLSASQLKTFDMCPRKWAFRIIDKKYPPENEYTRFGKELHDRVAKWLEHATDPGNDVIGKLIKKAIIKKYLPAPGPDVEAEKKFKHSIIKNSLGITEYELVAYVDCVYDPTQLIIDHKTCSSFRFMPTQEELKKDVQSIIYAFVYFEDNPEIDKCTNRWIYYASSGKKENKKVIGIKKVEIQYTREEIYNIYMPMIVFKLKKIADTRNKYETAIDVEPNFQSCNAYGGCDYLEECNPTDKQRFMALLTQAEAGTNKKGKNEMNLKDMLEKQFGKGVPKEKVIDVKHTTKPESKPESKPEPVYKKPEPRSEDTKEESWKALQKKFGMSPTEINSITPKEAEKVREETTKKETTKKEIVKKETKIKKTRKSKKDKPLIIVCLNAGALSKVVSIPVFLLSDLLKPIIEAIQAEHQVPHWQAFEYGTGKTLLAAAFKDCLEKNTDSMCISTSTSPELDAVKQVLLEQADIVVF